MLPDAPLPRGSSANRRLRDSLSECYITGRCLPAMTPTVLVMGDRSGRKRTSSDGQSQSTALQVADGLSDQTVGNVLCRHGISPAPKRKQTVSWKDFICSHWGVLVGMDFFTTEVLTLKGLTTYYVLFFIHLESRQVTLAGFTPYPDQEWMEQQVRNVTMEEWGSLRGCRYLLTTEIGSSAHPFE